MPKQISFSIFFSVNLLQIHIIMILYTNDSGKLSQINERPFKLERDIQNLFETNLNSIMNLEFVKSEFTIKNRRIDTLAFDRQNKSFIIIEYKRDKNISVIDQGFTYLSLMLENKADFIVEYNESVRQHLKREDVDWSQTKVAFVSSGFTENQIQATNFKDIAIELWEVKQFENNSIIISPIKKSRSAESIKPITQNKEEFTTVANEIKIYTEEEHLSIATEEIKELYEKFKNSILQLADNIEVRPKKVRISFQIANKIITDIAIQKKALKLWVNLRKGMLDDPKNLSRDVSSIGHWGNGDYEIITSSDKDLEYIMSLIKQAI